MRNTLANLVAVACLCGTVILSDAPTAWSAELDESKSKIDFVGRKPDGKHDGGFKKFSADAKLTPDNLGEGSLVIVIETGSLWSDNPKLTNHLKNPDFFDVRKHPKIKFESTKMSAGDTANKGVVTGKLTMLGKTNEVEIPVTCIVKDGVCRVEADFTIDRTKWGMNYGAEDGKINKEVELAVELAFKR